MKRVGLGRVIKKMATMFVPRSVKRKKDIKPDVSRKSNFVHDTNRKSHLKKVKISDERASASSDSLLSSNETLSPTVDDNLPIDEGEFDSEEEIVSYSKNQRWPTLGESVCVICGRYGAYIVDQTDKDVCSLECKARHLKDIARKKDKEPLDDGIIEDAIKISSNDGVLPNRMASNNEFKFHYKEHPFIAELPMTKVDNIRTKLKIKVKGDSISKPILEFQHCQLSETLNKNLSHFGYITPTPVQMQVIPLGLSSRDVLSCAQTGSGKTAAFLVPIIHRIYLEVGK